MKLKGTVIFSPIAKSKEKEIPVTSSYCALDAPKRSASNAINASFSIAEKSSTSANTDLNSVMVSVNKSLKSISELTLSPKTGKTNSSVSLFSKSPKKSSTSSRPSESVEIQGDISALSNIRGSSGSISNAVCSFV